MKEEAEEAAAQMAEAGGGRPVDGDEESIKHSKAGSWYAEQRSYRSSIRSDYGEESAVEESSIARFDRRLRRVLEITINNLVQ